MRASTLLPNIELELAIGEQTGHNRIAGLDEAGRGAIAGPVVAAAVVLPLDQPRLLERLDAVNDSKQLTRRQRNALYDLIVEVALAYGIGCSESRVIDEQGILPANALAMRAAAEQIEPPPQFLLLDGRMKLPALNLPQKSVIRGDQQSLSIAAASILAKVSRDRVMCEFDDAYPAYGFRRHKGYCTREHVAALREHGPCPIHRFTFSPIRQRLL